MSCSKAQEFLEQKQIKSRRLIDARQTAIDKTEVLKLVSDVDQIFVSKGKKIAYLDLTKDKPSREMIAQLLLGPTGNLRAPTLKTERILVVGFAEHLYQEILC